MGWLDGWFGGSSSNAQSNPLASLDPKVREFLNKESPVKYSAESDLEAELKQQREQEQRERAQRQKERDEAKVPSQSLYQDGRYAHLWKTYRPLAAVEAESKSDHEKLMDVLDGYKERKNAIGRAALENCADEQLEWNLCMKEGDWTKRARMCSEEVRRFERCYLTQSRLLKALGYLQVYERPPEVEERIQLHADRIYHDMLDREAKVEGAKREGKEVPSFGELIPKKEMPEGPEPGPETLKAWKTQLEKVPEEDRAAEEEALRAEWKAKAEMVGKIQALWQEQAKEREQRKAEGKETVMDKLKGLVGR
ncbi:hypothetical protein OQA88_3870 [Cercophora sp. LCS_1]